MRLSARWQTPVTVLALAGFAAALLYAPGAETAPGDVADLAVTKTDSPDPVTIGSPLSYTIQVSNLGPQGATGVTVSDQLPSQVEFVSATASGGTCARKGKTVTCDIGNLAADPSKANAVTVTIQVRPRKAGTIVNSASVDSVENDLVSANDQAQASTTVVAPPLVSRCRGVQATITGTRKSDTLVGTGGPDVIAGLGGDDVIFGLAGRDLICPGGGHDRVSAGTAADRVFGGVGRDRLRGGGGPDLLAGNPGADVLVGNRGNDRLRGNRGNDRLRGNRGRDLLRGGPGSDRCSGGSGFDRIRGCER